jgi:hypothetical protein
LLTTIAMENVNICCDLIEAAFDKIGPHGSWKQFNQEIGQTSRSPSAGGEREASDRGFEMVRAAYFDGEGLGAYFLKGFLPCGDMRGQTIATIINSRYGYLGRSRGDDQDPGPAVPSRQRPLASPGVGAGRVRRSGTGNPGGIIPGVPAASWVVSADTTRPFHKLYSSNSGSRLSIDLHITRRRQIKSIARQGVS